MKATTNTKEQNLVDILAAELDEIYYPGYSEEIMNSDPLKFQFELDEFKGQLAEEIKK